MKGWTKCFAYMYAVHIHTQLYIYIHTHTHSHYAILFSHKKEWSTDRCYNVDKPQKYYAKGKKANTEGHILYDSICMKYSEQKIHTASCWHI